jgi:hypothetical protein
VTRGRAARTGPCDAHDAQVRLSHAQSFLNVAELVLDTSDPDEYGNAAASLAVLAGIAASDRDRRITMMPSASSATFDREALTRPIISAAFSPSKTKRSTASCMWV